MVVIQRLTVADLNCYRSLVWNWMMKLNKSGELSEQDYRQFLEINERLEDSITTDNCDPLSGKIEVPELQPDALGIFKELTVWTEITFPEEVRRLKKFLH